MDPADAGALAAGAFLFPHCLHMCTSHLFATISFLSNRQLGIYSFFSGWYGMGKTSVTSRLNIPGRIAWMAMEVPGFTTLLYTVATLSKQHGIDDLPWQNRVLAGLFVRPPPT